MLPKQAIKLMKDIEVMDNFRKTLKPVSDTLIRMFYEELGLITTQTSTAIEGNAFTPKETYLFLSEEVTIPRRTIKEHLEIKGNHKAYNMLLTYVKDYNDISEDFIKLLNDFINLDKKSNNYKQSYRNVDTYIGTRNHIAHILPSFNKVPGLMKEWINKFNIDITKTSEDIKKNINIEEILTSVAKHHADFETIHPFIDGNGRTGRLLMNYELMRYGFYPIPIRNKAKYNEALRKYQSMGEDKKKSVESLKGLVIEIAKGIIETLDIWNSRFVDYKVRASSNNNLE